MNDPRLELFHTLQAAGVAPASPAELVPDGNLHRHHVEGDRRGTRNGWHVLHLDPPASGAGGSWKTGARVNWCAKHFRTLNHVELAILRRRIEQERATAQTEREAQHYEAAKRGAWVWKHARPAARNHDYLRRKGLEPGIARQRGDALVLPVLDFPGYLRGVQYIRPDGQKRFLSGMKKAGAFIPVAEKPDGKLQLWIAEGWATACALQALRPLVCVIAGLDAGNLQAVATEARRRWPALDIVLCPDFDSVGLRKAREAAERARAKILPPPAEIPPGCTDWNDFMASRRQGVTHA
ncbi:toprim domain-containing protein [Acidithiobacillus sp. AMEEHan]|uniref:toprim domain-containing protein n=1 Tax=Acidithiobacillus sp. AMEEHan TaxID=2994951 RepID=UPI0027E3DCEC|nr:toprim domain-containing protein [Acidithiobacillus sp. AMEEHan]